MRSIFLFFVVVLAVGAMNSGPARADDDGVAMGPMMCLYGYNDYRPCGSEPESGSPPAMSIPEAPPDPMLQFVPRYNATLGQLQRLVGGLDDLASIPPQTEGELSSRLSQLYVAGAYRLDSVNAVRAHNAAVAARAAQMSDELAKMETSIAAAAARKQGYVQAYKAWIASGGLSEHRRLKAFEAAFDARISLLANRSNQTAQRVVEWLWVAGVPAAQRSPRTVQRIAPETYVGALADIEQDIPLVIASRPQLPIVTHGVAFRAPPSGSVGQMLDTVERLVPQIQTAVGALEREQPAAAAAEAAAAGLDIKMRTIQALSDRVAREAHDAQARAETAQSNLDATRRRATAAAKNMLVDAIEARALSRSERKAKAAVKEFLRVNGNATELAALTDAKVAELYRASRVALHLAPKTAIRGMDKFLAVQKQILDDLKNPFKSAIAAGNALGSATQGGSEEAVAVFRGLSRDSLTYAEKAGESLPPGVREQALGMLEAVD